MAIMAPLCGPRKSSISREKGSGVQNSRPLGSGMVSSAYGIFCSREKYCQKGGMASSLARQPLSSLAEPQRRAGERGPRWRSWPPSRDPSETPVCREKPVGSPSADPRNSRFAGESPWGSAIHALWGPEWSRLAFHDGHKYCHDGGIVLLCLFTTRTRPREEAIFADHRGAPCGVSAHILSKPSDSLFDCISVSELEAASWTQNEKGRLDLSQAQGRGREAQGIPPESFI